MPPKPKNTKEEIAIVAYKIIKQEGLLALSARRLGKILNASASSIFTVLPNMEAVKMAARKIALEEFKEYISDYREYTPAFKRIGLMIVSYGINEPELFKLLFMQEHPSHLGFEESLKDLDDIPQVCQQLIQKDYNMSQEEAKMLFELLWVQAYGLGCMCAMRVISLNEIEISKRLSLVFAGLVMLIKSGEIKKVYMDVNEKKDGTYHGLNLTDFPFVFVQKKKNN